MKNEFSFDTIKTPVTDVLYKEKGSKFIGFTFPVADEKVVQEKLREIREVHPKATHHCYAFRLGLNGENYRAQDDGEPSGSAGLPIYNQLLANNLTQILLIVVRYYGGTKLGVSGLVKAYKETAKYTLEQSTILTQELETEIEIEFEFSQQNVIFSLLNRFDVSITDFVTEEQCRIKAQIKLADQQKISELLSEIQYVRFKLKA